MALVSTLLEELKPLTWTNTSYNNRCFVKVKLSEDSKEYSEIYFVFRQQYQLRVVNIYRIQHPFAFCRYKLRQRHLFYRSRAIVQESRVLFRLTDDNRVDEILKYNCDERRDAVFKGSIVNKNGKFIVVVKTFQGHGFNDRESNHYPEYLIECDLRTYNNINANKNINLNNYQNTHNYKIVSNVKNVINVKNSNNNKNANNDENPYSDKNLDSYRNLLIMVIIGYVVFKLSKHQ